MSDDHLIAVTDFVIWGNYGDPIFKQIVLILEEEFNLTPYQVHLRLCDDGHLRVYKNDKT